MKSRANKLGQSVALPRTFVFVCVQYCTPDPVFSVVVFGSILALYLYKHNMAAMTTGKHASEDASEKATPSLGAYKVGYFLLYASECISRAFQSLYLKQLGISPYEVGIVMFCGQFGGFVGGATAPYLVAKLPRNAHCYVFPGLYLFFFMSLSFAQQLPLRTDCPENMLNITQNMELNSSHIEHTSDNCDISLMFDPSNVAWLVLFLAIIGFCGDFFILATEATQEAVTMKSLKKTNKADDYGRVRAWGALGFATGSITTGLAVNFTVKQKIICSLRYFIADYHSMFYLLAFFAGGRLLSAGNFKESEKVTDIDQKNLIPGRDFRRALGTSRNISWLMVLLMRTVFFGVSTGFLKWYMEDIGASPALIGVSGGITTVAEFVVFFFTPQLIQRFGHVTLANVGIVSYAVRFIIFSFITNPVFVLPIEVLEGVMFACIWTSIVSHLSSLVPPEGQNQMQGLVQSLRMLGMAIGFLSSGALTQVFGAPVMFRIFSGVAAITWLIFTLAHVLPDQVLVT